MLREVNDEPVGEYGNQAVVRYRKFWLGTAQNGAETVNWALYREEVNNEGQVYYAQEGGGILTGLTQIPFRPVRDLGEPPPLMDIALKNIEHFQS